MYEYNPIMDKTTQVALGAGAAVFFHPITYVKILIQIGHEPIAPTLHTSMFGHKSYMYPNVFTYANHIRKTDGFCQLYRGLGARIVSSMASNFVSNAIQTRLFEHPPDAELGPSSPTKADETYIDGIKKLAKDTLAETCSACAGIVVSQPFRVIFIRSIAQYVGHETKYSCFSSSVREIYQNEGILGFFSGLIPRLIGEVLTIWLANVLTHAINTFLLADPEHKDKRQYTNIFSHLVVNQITYPFSVVSNVMTINGSGLVAGTPPYSGWMDCWSHLSSQNQLMRGSGLFWRGYKGQSFLNKAGESVPVIEQHFKY